MSAATARHPRAQLGRRRSGIATHVELSPTLRRLVDEQAELYGIAKKDVIVMALVRHFSQDLPDVKELAKLARTWLNQQVNGRRP